jgi:hypothetical protein
MAAARDKLGHGEGREGCDASERHCLVLVLRPARAGADGVDAETAFEMSRWFGEGNRVEAPCSFFQIPSRLETGTRRHCTLGRQCL